MEETNEISLNENDKKLIRLVYPFPKSVNAIAREIGISPSNISTRLLRLEKAGLIKVERQNKKGKKTMISLNNDQEIKKYIILLLEKFKELGGDLSEEEFMELPKKIGGVDKSNWKGLGSAIANLNWGETDLIQRRRKLTEKGKKFLEENSNEKR